MLGERIRERRLKLGIEQQALAERVGIRAQALWRLEIGKTKNPGIQLVTAIAAALGVTIDELVHGTRTPAATAGGQHSAIPPLPSDVPLFAKPRVDPDDNPLVLTRRTDIAPRGMPAVNVAVKDSGQRRRATDRTGRAQR